MPTNTVGPTPEPLHLPTEVRRLAEASAVIAKAAPGDLVLFRAHTAASALTKAATRSGYSHAGIIAPFETPGGKLALYEAARASYGTVNLLHGAVEFHGVHVWEIKERVQNYRGEAWLVPLSPPLTAAQTAALTEYCMKHARERTPFDQAQMIPAGVDLPGEGNPGRQLFEARDDADDKLFCTEFIGFGLAEAGLFSGNAAEFTPADVLHLPIVGMPVLIKLYEAAETNPLARLGVSREVADALLTEELGVGMPPCCVPTISRSLHTSRYLLNRLPQGRLKAVEGQAGSARGQFVDDSGATWQREHSCLIAGCLFAPFCFTLRLRDSAAGGRLASSGSSSVLVGHADLAKGAIAAEGWSPGTYWFKDPRDAGWLQHLAHDLLPAACCWLLCCTGLQRRHTALEARLVGAQQQASPS